MIRLDLTAGGVLAPEHLRRLDALAADNIGTFNAMIAEAGRDHAHDIDWWVSRPASRNVFVSPLFNRCMQLLLIQELLSRRETVEVLTDDGAFARTLRDMRSPNLAVSYRRTPLARLRPLLGALHNIASALFHTAAAAIAANRTRPTPDPLGQTPLTVVDVFVLRDSVTDGVFRDRYFPGLLDGLDEAARKGFCYMPTFYRIRDYHALFKALRAQKTPFLFQQDHLKPSDYVFAFGYWLRAGKLGRDPVRFAGVRVDAMVRADLAAGRFAQSVIPALLSWRFWSRKRDSGLNVTRVIDWYEGQDLDHAQAAAINWSDRKIALTGFMPACSRFELSVTPAAHEIAAGVVPRTMAVTGEGFCREVARTNPDLHTMTAPGLRYRRLAALQPAGDGRGILVALPLAAPAIAGIRDLIVPAMNGTARWWLKRHPAMPRAEIERLFGPLPANCEFVEGDFYDWLPKASLVIGLESSALLEAIAIGVPAICAARGNIPTKIPFPDWADRGLWRVCYDTPELQAAVRELATDVRGDADSAGLRQNLLSPATDASKRAFLEAVDDRAVTI